MIKKILKQIQRTFFYYFNPRRRIETLNITQEDREMAQRIRDAIVESKETHIWNVLEYIVKSLEEIDAFFRITFLEGIIAILANALEKQNMLTERAFSTLTNVDILLPEGKVDVENTKYVNHPAWNALNQAIEGLVLQQDWVDNFPRETVLAIMIDILLINKVLKEKDDIDLSLQEPSIYDLKIKLIPHYDVTNEDGLKIQEIAVDGVLLWEREFTVEER